MWERILVDDYGQVLELLEDERVQYGVELPTQLHKKLCLGQTRYVCRYGTLGDGHEHFTPARRYFQSIREIYYLANAIKDYRCVVMDARADQLEAEQLPEGTEVQHLRKTAAVLRAKNKLTSALVTIQDSMRMLDEYDKVRQELEPEIEAKYPDGIEQAEPDNWRAIFDYRMIKGRTPGLAPAELSSIPMPLEQKAALGYQYGRFDAIAPLAVAQPEQCKQLEGSMQPQIESKGDL